MIVSNQLNIISFLFKYERGAEPQLLLHDESDAVKEVLR